MSVAGTIQKAIVIGALGAAAGYAHWALRGPLNLTPNKEVTTTITLDDGPETAVAGTPTPTDGAETTTATPPPADAEPTAPAAAPRTMTLGFEITLEQAKLLFDRGVTFIDARHTA